MATTITMPQLGETVTEGTVAQWLKKPGDTIEKYEAFVEVSTDKVNAEVPAPVSGVLREIIVAEGETVPTGAPIAVIDEVAVSTAGGNPFQQTTSGPPGSDEPVPGHTNPREEPSSYGMSGQGPGVATPPGGLDEPIPAASRSSNGAAGSGVAVETLRGASPAVRRLAREHSVDVTHIRGTGTNGRVTAKDILAAAAAGPSAAVGAAISAAPPAPPVRTGPSTYANPIPGTTIPLSQARKIIAQRMVESKRTAPHAWTMVEIDVTNVWKWRTREKDTFERDNGIKLTLLPFFMRAVVESLAQFPLMNASFAEDGIKVHKDVNIAIAVALPDNLILPVVRGADKLSIKGLALAAGGLIEKARRGKLGADDLAGGTFTVNNTGASGSVLSAPIIPIPQAGIVTMETVVKRTVVRPDDSIAIRSMMNSCLSLDHRVVDGGVAIAFLSDLKKRLEAMGPGGSL